MLKATQQTITVDTEEHKKTKSLIQLRNVKRKKSNAKKKNQKKKSTTKCKL